MVDTAHFAHEWVAAWNAHDLERVLSHYAPDARVISPLAAQRVIGSGGIVVGHDALRAYWGPALGPGSTIHFELLDVLRTVDGATILYRNEHGQQVAETVLWGSDGVVTQAVVAYGPRP